jgi:hypothetical protein
MEYVERQALHRCLAEPILVIEFWPIATECALDLAAHNAGIVHHEIKSRKEKLSLSYGWQEDLT